MRDSFLRRWIPPWFAWVGWLLAGLPVVVSAAEQPFEADVIAFKLDVKLLRAGATTWDQAGTNRLFAGDQVRTGERSRATLRMHDGSIVQLDEFSQVRLGRRQERGVIELLRGVMSFFHRDKPGRIEVIGNGVSALVRGTEFTFAARPDGSVDLALFDGEVGFTNQVDGLVLRSGEVATARPGEAPRRTAVLAGGDAASVQWLLYYPAVLALPELPLEPAVRTELAEALHRHEEGDLLGALASYPAGRQPASREERVLLAALVLAVGNVAEAERWLDGITGDDATARIAAALRQVMAAAQLQPGADIREPNLATEWMAASYARQAGRDLPGALPAALAAARRAVEVMPDFGFGWARVAELEFSFGRVKAAQAALDRALVLAPRNAQAVALRGFLLAAEYRTGAAETAFAEALMLDPGLGNAWLGRGLARIQQGQLDDGRADLTVAVATEPNRALLRSYLGKAYAAASDTDRAVHELDLARRIDPLDPTAWLYAALLHQQRGQVNDALRAYGEAEARNQQRALYRSGLLLDQDRAVMNANRAAAFRDAGLTDFAVLEAGRALSGDAANPSAHLFLAESYLDASRVNLRYETPRVGEYLQANLLAPVGGGVLSANLSQQDYGRLFEQDGLHLFSQTTYRSVGGWEQAGGVFGTSGRIGYLLDAYYVTDPGYAPNTDFEQTAFDAQFKAQVADRDTLYVQVLRADSEAGDLASYTDPAFARATLRVQETLEPILLVGWHRAWSPEHHTLFLAGWLRSEQALQDGAVDLPLFVNGRDGTIAAALPLGQLEQSYLSRENWLTTEAQHLWQTGWNSLVAGLRYQRGEVDAWNGFTALPPAIASFNPRVTPDAERFQGYVYDTVRPWESLAVTLGLSYDVLEHPINYRAGPLSETTDRVSQWSPKAGIVWMLRTNLWLRGAYTRSLGGVSYEQSVRLEPTQVAGFNQAYRSLISESLAGALSATRHETWQLAAETRLGSGTFLAIQAEHLRSEAGAPQGIFRGSSTAAAATTTPVQLNYEERSLAFSAAQLIGQDWSVFARYRVSDAELDRHWLEMGNLAPNFTWPGVGPAVHSEAELHSLTFGVRFNHESGWFAGADATWFWQPARTATEPVESAPAESVWQLGLFVGHRFWQRRAELAVGVENLLDQDYRLHPLGGLGSLPRERTAVLRLKWVW